MPDTALPQLMMAPGEISRQLTARAARLALAVADVLEASTSSESGAAHAVGFLRDWARSASTVLPEAYQPLDVLVDHYQLCAAEVELLAARGARRGARGTGGHVACTAPARRSTAVGRPGGPRARPVWLPPNGAAGVAEHGRAVRFRLLRVVGPGALFFERSLVLADQLWEALHGLDAFPADLERVTSRPRRQGWMTGWPSRPHGMPQGLCATARR